jgi:hypothetical protein
MQAAMAEMTCRSIGLDDKGRRLGGRPNVGSNLGGVMGWGLRELQAPVPQCNGVGEMLRLRFQRRMQMGVMERGGV